MEQSLNLKKMRIKDIKETSAINLNFSQRSNFDSKCIIGEKMKNQLKVNLF